MLGAEDIFWTSVPMFGITVNIYRHRLYSLTKEEDIGKVAEVKNKKIFIKKQQEQDGES